MADDLHILGIAGSLRLQSYNRALLRAATELVPEGMRIEIYEGIEQFPFYNDDLAGTAYPANVAAFKDKLRAADGILIVTPEYNWGIPGVLKNAIEWGSRPGNENAWAGKPLAIMGVSTGQTGTVRGQMQLRQYATVLNMHTLNRPEVLVNNARAKFDEALNFTDETGRGFVQQQLAAFAQWIRRLQRGLEP
jgi:chromate reductase